MNIKLSIKEEDFPFKSVFRIAHGARSVAKVVTVTLKDNIGNIGRGECVPYPRYNESCESVIQQIEDIRLNIENGLDNLELLQIMPNGAARNAIDCAIWDLKAKASQNPIWELLGLEKPKKLITALTIVIDSKEKMVADAIKAYKYPILKIKIGSPQDFESIIAISEARKDAKFIIDANEALDINSLKELVKIAEKIDTLLIEQPLKSGDDLEINKLSTNIPICADESFHTSKEIAKFKNIYDAVNIKLDKTGGITEALIAIKEAKANNMQILSGCMVGTSLGAAPACILASLADFVDLDGPLLLAKDRNPPLIYDGAIIDPINRELWG